MVPISHLSQFKQKLGMFGGKIWIDTYGACSYECALCQKTFFSAGSFEYHVSHDHRNQFTRSNQTVTNTVHPNQVVLDKSHNKNPTGFNVDRPLHVKSTIEIIDSGAKQAVHVKSHNEPSGYDVNRSLRVNSNNGTTNYGAKQARPVKFYNETNTKYGERQRKNNDELICKKCNKTFDTLERVRTHTRDYHQYQCTYCPTDTVKGFETEKGLWSHQRNCHPKIFPYSCAVCPRAFKHRDDLKNHKQSNHVRGNDVKCDFCWKKLMSTFEKENHIKKEHSDRRYYCFLCTEYSTKNATNLRRHTKEKHPGKKQPDR